MDVDALTDDLARVMGAARASTAGGNDGTSRAARCVRGVAGCLTRKMSVGEAVRACAAPAAKVLAHRALRDVGRRVDEATLRDIERLCEGTIAWACEEGRAVTISEVLHELELRLSDFEASLAAGWRGIEFSASNPESPAHADVDDRRMDVFHSVAATKNRASERGRVIDEWRDELLEKLEPEENLKSIIKPRLLLRAYELLSDRKVVNDDAVEDMVNKRFDKWTEMWRLHAQHQRRETGSAPDHEGFKDYLHSFLGTKLPAFANGVHKSSFKVQLVRETETEKLAKATAELERSARPPSDVTKLKHTLEHAIQALRAAETSNDVCALLTTRWMREALVDAPTFSQPAKKSSKNVDSGGQMMKDWQREEGFVLRFSNRHGGASSGNAAGFKNISDDAWKESYVSTGPFRVHFMRACAEIEAALQDCSTCNLHNVSADEKREACVKGAARVMFVASRTMRSGDGLDFVHNLFGPPPEFSVSLVDPGKTKKIVAENSSIGTPIVVEVTRDIVTIRCVDVFVIVKHCFADETNASNARSARRATEASDSLRPWACVALETTQSLRTASDGSLKLVKQRIAVDKNIPQPVLDAFLAVSLDSADVVRASRPPLRLRVSADAFAAGLAAVVRPRIGIGAIVVVAITPRANARERAARARALERAREGVARVASVAMLARDVARDVARATRDAREDLAFGSAATMRFTRAPTSARGTSEAVRASPTQARIAAEARERGEGRTRSPSPAKRSRKGKPRSTRTGAVSARTRLAFSPEAAVAMLRGMNRRAGKGGNGGGGEANASANERGKRTKTETKKKPPPRKLVRSESFKYLNEAGELEAVEGAPNGRDGGKNDGGGAGLAGANGNGYKTTASGAKRGRGEQPLPSTSGGGAGSKTKKQALRAKSETRRVSLDPRGRAKNKPFENNTLYQPGNVIVGLHLNTRGGKEWYTNKQLVGSCKPGSLLDISSKSLTAPTKAAISSALRDEANGEKVEKFVRVKVMSHYLDVSGWTLTTVQVVPLRWNRHGPKHILPLCAAAGVELVFNLTEEAAYGCLRVFRFPIGSNGHLSELRKSTKGATSPSTLDSERVVRPSTPPRMRTPSPKKRKNRAHGGSSDRTSDPSNAAAAAAAAEALEAQEEDEDEEDAEEDGDGDGDGDEDEDEDEELGEAFIPENGLHSKLPSSLPVIKPVLGTPFWDQPRNATNAEVELGAPVLTIGEIGGIEQRHIETPRKRTVDSPLFDNGRAQLREFYDRFHERATIDAARPYREHVVTTDTYVPSGSPLTMSLPQSQVHNMPPVAAQRFVSPTVYYLPVPISPHGASGTITETIVGGMRLRITQEPIEGWARHDVVAETANNPHPQLRTESDAFSDVHRERQRVNAKRGVPKARAKQMRVQDDDDNLLAANLLMLKTSVAGQKRKPPTPSKPSAKRAKSQKVDSARKSR